MTQEATNLTKLKCAHLMAEHDVKFWRGNMNAFELRKTLCQTDTARAECDTNVSWYRSKLTDAILYADRLEAAIKAQVNADTLYEIAFKPL